MTQEAPRKSPPLWLLVLITLSGTMAMHMVVPALPDIARELGAGSGQVQLTISLFVGGLAVGQLFYGPLSDALGRRPLLLAGLAIYAAAGVAALFATSLGMLLALRLLQALGACAGLTLGRAIVRDTSQPEAVVRQLALLNLMVMVGPGLSPVIGGALAGAGGWRWVFVLLSGLGLLTFVFAWRLLPETGRPAGRIGAGPVLRNYAALLRSPRFVGLAIGGGCGTTSIYALLAAAPFIFIQMLHQSEHLVGIYVGLLALGVAAGTALVGRLSRRVPPQALTRGAMLLCLVCALAFLAVVASGHASVATTLGLMLPYACGCGMAGPSTMGQALNVDPRRIGSAAGLYGFTQMAVGAACTSLAALGSNPALTAALILAGTATLAQLALTIGLRHPAGREGAAEA